MLATSNRLLRVLTPDQRALLEPLELVELRAGEVIYRMEDPVTHFILPEKMLVSLVFTLSDGQRVDMMEGGRALLGGHTLFQVPEGLHELLVRIGGFGWRVPRERVLAAMEQNPPLFARLRALVHLMDRTMAQSMACRSVHSIEQRFARLMLHIFDTIEDAHIQLSVPVIAQMLPANRSYLQRLMRGLAAQGIITTNRQHIELNDLRALAAISCRCHRELVVQRERVFG
jgi:CRP-like cAMP-binding protein